MKTYRVRIYGPEALAHKPNPDPYFVPPPDANGAVYVDQVTNTITQTVAREWTTPDYPPHRAIADMFAGVDA